eukprot:scaffold2744_cov160-Amphora_coffeaeformis.AAC.1
MAFRSVLFFLIASFATVSAFTTPRKQMVSTKVSPPPGFTSEPAFLFKKPKEEEDWSDIEVRDMTREEMSRLNDENERIMNAELWASRKSSSLYLFIVGGVVGVAAEPTASSVPLYSQEFDEKTAKNPSLPLAKRTIVATPPALSHSVDVDNAIVGIPEIRTMQIELPTRLGGSRRQKTAEDGFGTKEKQKSHSCGIVP